MKPQAHTALCHRSLAFLAKSLWVTSLLWGALATVGWSQSQNPEAIEIRVPNNKKAGDAESFQTDLFTGQFVYNFPIVLPPGRGGSEPGLALRYSSGGGTGWCGVGWSLDVGYIERDTTYGVPVDWIDNPNDNTLTPAQRYEDVFVAAYSGVNSKLIAKTSIDYGPEVETAFITFTRTVDHWVATDRSGNKAYFGETPDSRMENPKWPGAPTWDKTFRWCLNRTVDANGNEAIYQYDQVGSQPILDSIHYNGHTAFAPTHHVTFIRNDMRLDRTTSYQSNFRVEMQSLLQSIVIDVNGVVARSYELVYNTSPSTFRALLYQITERAADGSTKQAVPLTFSYQVKPLEYEVADESSWGPLLTEGGTANLWKCPRGNDMVSADYMVVADLIDFDSDGFLDRVLRKKDTYNQYLVQFNTGSGFDLTMLYPFPIEIENNGQAAWGSIEWKQFGIFGGNETPMRVIDFNGDGRPDRIRRRDWNGPGENLLCQLNNGWGLNSGEEVYYLDNQGQPWRSWNSPEGYTDNTPGSVKAGLFDLTGDGRPERVMRPHNPPYNRFLVQKNVTPYTYSIGPGTWAGFEGDGNVGVDQIWPIEAQDGTYQAEGWNGPMLNGAQGTLVGLFDLNGDGLLDRVMQEDGTNKYPSGNNNKYDAFAVQFNNGAGFEPIDWWPIAQLASNISDYWNRPVGTAAQDPSEDLTTLLDINGDGLLDRVMRSNSGPYDHFEVQFNIGTGFQPSFTSYPVPEYNPPGVSWGATSLRNVNSQLLVLSEDMNGDGLVDRVMRRDNTPYTDGFAVQLNKGPYPDLLSGIDNGIGGTVQVSYIPSTQYDNRDREWQGANPDPWSAGAKSLLPFPVQTVASVTTNDGFSPLAVRTYGYENGMYHPASREFRGFNCVEEAVLESGSPKRITRTYFHQGSGSIDKSSDGEYLDNNSIAKKGIPYLVEVYDGSGVLLHQNFAKVEEFALGGGRAFPFVSQETQWDHEGLASGNVRGVATQYAYDSIGRLTKVTELGEVEYDNWDPASHSFQDIPGDSRYTHSTYNDPDAIDKPDRTWVSSDDLGLMVFKDTRFDWDSKSNLLEERYWQNLPAPATWIEESFSYDSYGNLENHTNVNGVLTQTAYELAHHQYPETETVDPAGLLLQTQFTFDPLSGNVKTRTDPAGLTERTVYDQFFRPTERVVDLPSGGGSVWKERFEYQLAGLGSGYSYNYVHQKTNDGVDATNGLEHRTYFDGLGRVIQERTESETLGCPPAVEYRVTSTEYDAEGNVRVETLPYFSCGPSFVPYALGSLPGTVTEYDAASRPETVTPPISTDPESPTGPVTFSFGAAGNPWVTRMEDATSAERDSERNAYGQLVRITEDPAGVANVTQHEYDLLGNLIRTTDAAGNEIVLQYDSLGRKIDMQDPDMGHWRYEYDNAGQLKKQVDAEGHMVRTTYDNVGRVFQVDVYENETDPNPVEVVTYQYDAGEQGFTVYKGQLFKMTDNEGWTKFSYDVQGRVLKKIRYLNKTGQSYRLDWDYNDGDKVKVLTYPGAQALRATLEFIYNTGGYLKKVKSQRGTGPAVETFFTAAGYNESGELQGINYGNGVSTAYTYFTESDRLESVATTSGATSLQNLSYEYNAIGDVARITDTVHTSGAGSGSIMGITYDVLHRLTGYTHGGTPYSFTYDAIGNLTSSGESSHGAYSYPLPGAVRPHAVSQTNTTTYSYDDNGNLIQRGPTGGPYDTLHYSPRNQLSSVTTSAGTVTFGYDGQCKRLWRQSGTDLTIWIDGLYEERGGKTLCHVIADGRRICTFEPHFNTEPPQWGEPQPLYQYIHGDHLRSTNVVTDQTGSQTQYRRYKAFGGDGHVQNPSAFAASNLFTDQVFDADTGLYYFGARYYDPNLGRFTQPDPIIPDPGDPQALNRYSYVLNNPFRYVDPSGHGVGDWWRQTRVGKWANAKAAAAWGGTQRAAAFVAEKVDYAAGVTWETTRGVGSGLLQTGGAALDGAWQSVRHPIATAEAVGTALYNYEETAQAITEAVGQTVDDVVNGDAYTRGQIAGNLMGGVALSIVGDKGLSKLSKLGRLGRAVDAATPDVPNSAALRQPTDFLTNVSVKSHGRVIAEGTVDVRNTVQGIQSSSLVSRGVFHNREGRLPKRPLGYYQEYVHPTPGVEGAGPQRIIAGQGGDLYYTPDHYQSFVPLNIVPLVLP